MLWACWYTLASLTNLFDFMHGIGNLPDSWLFRSDNYANLQQVFSIYHTPSFFVSFLFICDMSAQAISAILFWIAFICFFSNNKYKWQFINAAFGFSIALWSVFLVLQEIFIAYALEHVFIRLSAYEMLTFIMIHLLPGYSRTNYQELTNSEVLPEYHGQNHQI